jgi:Ca2+-binding EF-hand superfamily protein
MLVEHGEIYRNSSIIQRINANELAYGILLFMTNFVIDFSDQAELVQSFNQIDISEDGELDEKEVKTALTTYNAIHPTRA